MSSVRQFQSLAQEFANATEEYVKVSDALRLEQVHRFASGS